MDHDGQLIWEAYFNEMGRPFGMTELSDDKIEAVKLALQQGYIEVPDGNRHPATFVNIARVEELTTHVVKQIADSIGIKHPRGRLPGVRENEQRYRDIMLRIFRIHHLGSKETYADIARDKNLFPDHPVTGEPRPASRQYISKLAHDAGYSKNKPRTKGDDFTPPVASH
jgi:hypothetical protein